MATGWEQDAGTDGPAPEGPWIVDDRPSLLIVAPSLWQPEAQAMAAGAGFRVTGAISRHELAGHLARLVGVDALLVDLRGLNGADPKLMDILVTLLAWPAWTDAQPLILVDLPAMDIVAAMLHLRFDSLLCEASPAEIGVALCLLAREGPVPTVLHDIGRETDAARLDQLGAEVRRLAQTIDRLVRGESPEPAASLRDRSTDYAPQPSFDTATPDRNPKTTGTASKQATRSEIRAILQVRRMRDRFLPGDLFADPAWDMMLDLLGARLDGKSVSVSSLCIAAAVPPTTALRWIAQLTEKGIFQRSNDPDDARRVFISLSDDTADRLTKWFSAVRQTGLRLAD